MKIIKYKKTMESLPLLFALIRNLVRLCYNKTAFDGVILKDKNCKIFIPRQR